MCIVVRASSESINSLDVITPLETEYDPEGSEWTQYIRSGPTSALS